MSAPDASRVVDAASVPSLPTLLEQLTRLEQAAQQSNNAVEQTRVNTLVHELSSHIPPSTLPSPSDLFAEVGYDILHCLLPLVSPDAIHAAATGQSAIKDVSGSVLACTVLYGSPREVFLPLLSHLSAHITPHAQRQEEEKQPLFDEQKQPPLPVEQQLSIPYVSFLLPYFVCLLQREKHVARQASMFTSLSSLLAAFFAALPTDDALTTLLTPLRPVLRADNDAHVGFLLSLLASYLPPQYPQPFSQPSPSFSLLLSHLPDTAVSATFSLTALTSYIRRRHSLTQQLSTMRQQSWELTEDEESITRAQHQSWHAAATADDETDEADEDDQDEQERQQRSELRQIKAQLTALPPYPPAGIVCLVLMKLQANDKSEVERLVRGAEGGVAGLRVYVDAMMGTDIAGRYRQVMIDLLHYWLSRVLPQSLQYTPVSSAAAVDEQSKDDSWMLAECITTLMMQPPTSHPTGLPPTSSSTAAVIISSSALLPLYLSRFTPTSRFTLTAALIPACPFPPIQAILVSTLKDTLVTSNTQQHVTLVTELLVALLAEWSDVRVVLERVDGLLAVMNVFRFVLLRFGVAELSTTRRQQILAAVRMMQQRVVQGEDRESGQPRKEVDLPLWLLKDLTARVLELT